MTTPDAKLLPCPCCHSERIEHEHDPRCFSGQVYEGYPYPDGYKARCTDCGMQTCWWHTKSEMLQAWNTRHTASTEPSEAEVEAACDAYTQAHPRGDFPNPAWIKAALRAARINGEG